MEFSSANHKLDFDLWTWPQVDPTAPSYVMKNTLDQPTLAEKEETKRREEQAWEQKVVVDNTRLLTYRSEFFIFNFCFQLLFSTFFFPLLFFFFLFFIFFYFFHFLL